MSSWQQFKVADIIINNVLVIPQTDVLLFAVCVVSCC